MSEARRRFEAQVLPHLDAAYRFARWLSAAPGHADDVVQDAVLRAFRGFDSFRGGDTRAWLFAIVRNCHETAVAQERKRVFVPLPDESGGDRGALHMVSNAEEDARRRDDASVLGRLMSALSEEYREVLVLRELEEMSYRDIATIAGIPIGTVMSRLARARRAHADRGARAGEIGMSCPETLRIHAYFDGELAAGDLVLVEHHVARCAACRGLLAQLEDGRALLRRAAPDLRVPVDLHARIGRALDAQSARALDAQPAKSTSSWRSRPFWLGALAGCGLSGVTAALCVLLVLPMASSPLVDELVAAHVHSLEPGNLISVRSSERHTVKPWFAGRADVSPTVADFASDGFMLVGGRTDAVRDQRAAVAVYRHGPHTINVFTWAESRGVLPRAQTRNGYRLLFWRSADLLYAAVSDTSWDELRTFERLLQARSAIELRSEP
jgi:RNA polymerase sigma factor (sigma-70 family)